MIIFGARNKMLWSQKNLQTTIVSGEILWYAIKASHTGR